jgi:5-methylcytosine-specific restriction endonuclease McrA
MCGYSRSRKALHFHHVNPGDKKFRISGKWAMSWENLRTELDKCIIVCANCHAEIHDDTTATLDRIRKDPGKENG